MRNKVKRSACQSNDHWSCETGLVTPEIAELFDTHPDCNSVLLTKEGDMVKIPIRKY